MDEEQNKEAQQKAMDASMLNQTPENTAQPPVGVPTEGQPAPSQPAESTPAPQPTEGVPQLPDKPNASEDLAAAAVAPAENTAQTPEQAQTGINAPEQPSEEKKPEENTAQ